MKACIHTKNDTIKKYLLGQLSEQEELEFQVHASECDACYRRLQAMKNLENSFDTDNTDVVKPVKRIVMKRLFAVAAVVLLLLGVGGYFFINRDFKEANDIPLMVHKDSVNVPVKDTLRKNATQPDTKIAKPNQDHLAVNHVEIIDAPKFAGQDSIKGLDTYNAFFKVIVPKNNYEELELKPVGNNFYEFKWKAPEIKSTVILIKREKTILDQFMVDDKNSIVINLDNYTEYPDIEWVIMWGESKNRQQGILVLKK